MRIVHTEASCGWGGQEIRILSEAKGLADRGHEVLLLAPSEARILKEAKRRGVRAQALPIGGKNLRGVWALRRWLAKHEVDVINTHSSTDSWLAAAACATRLRAPPIVRTRHISAAVPENKTTQWLYTRATRHIVTTGELLRQQLIRDNGYPAQSITSVPTGVDSTVFAPGDRVAARRVLKLPVRLTLVGIVATLRSWKGHRFLIEAFAQLENPDCALVIVGGGPQAAKVDDLIKEKGLSARVFTPGNQRDVLPWLNALDIFALPSYANEGVPQALVQAMLCELPCVTTAVGSISEAAIDGKTAMVVPSENVESLTRALDLLVGEPNLRYRLGRAAREHCERHFSYTTMLDQMEAIFKRVAVRARGPQ